MSSNLAHAAPLRARPNIYHIVADDLGYADLSHRRSPHLEALRKSGVSLTNLYTFKTCGPSRAAMLTGRYPFHIGIYSNADIDSYGVPSNFTFLPALLKRHGGYATHAMYAILHDCDNQVLHTRPHANATHSSILDSLNTAAGSGTSDIAQKSRHPSNGDSTRSLAFGAAAQITFATALPWMMALSTKRTRRRRAR